MRGEALKEHRGGVRAATLVGTPYVGAEGTVVADVIDLYGNVWTACRIIVQGGGAGAFVHAPPGAGAVEGDRTPAEVGGDVMLSFPDGSIPHPVILGVAQSQLARGRFATLEQPNDTDAYPDQNDPLDTALERGGARLVVSRFGRLLLSTKQGEQPVEIVASPRSFVWLSLGEADTGDAERLLLAGPMRAYVDALTAKLNDVDATLVALQNAVKTFAATAVTAGPVDPAFLAFATSLSTTLQTLTASPQDATTDAINASAVRISPTSQAEE